MDGRMGERMREWMDGRMDEGDESVENTCMDG